MLVFIMSFAENTKHLCDVRDEVCTVDLPHKASDYDDCTVIKHYFSGTKEEVTIDSANNCFYIKRVPRTLDAIYTFSCAKGDHEVYSYINIELRGKWTRFSVIQFHINFSVLIKSVSVRSLF